MCCDTPVCLMYVDVDSGWECRQTYTRECTTNQHRLGEAECVWGEWEWDN